MKSGRRLVSECIVPFAEPVHVKQLRTNFRSSVRKNRQLFLTWVQLENEEVGKCKSAPKNLSSMTTHFLSGNSIVSNHDSFYQLLEYIFCCFPEVNRVTLDLWRYRQMKQDVGNQYRRKYRGFHIGLKHLFVFRLGMQCQNSVLVMEKQDKVFHCNVCQPETNFSRPIWSPL